MIPKIKQRLARWKGRQLSFAGRDTVIKSVITTLLFFLSLFKAPKLVIKEITNIQRHFFIGVGIRGKENIIGEMDKHMQTKR